MLIGINPDRTSSESFSDKWEESLESQGHTTRKLDLSRSDWLEQVSGCDGVMWRYIHFPRQQLYAPHVLRVIEKELRIPVFPDEHTRWHFDSKIAQWYLLSALSAPMPKTMIFWHPEEALSWARDMEYPLVAKLSHGAGSSNVRLLRDYEEARRYIWQSFYVGVFAQTPSRTPIESSVWEKLRLVFPRLRATAKYLLFGDYPPLPKMLWMPSKDYVYFQEYLPGNSYDTRVTVIGDWAFAYRRLNRPNDFRASGSGNFDVNPDEIDTRCVELALDISQRAGFQCMTYDFLFQDKEPMITEISYGFVDWMVESCPGQWSKDLEWSSGRKWPEEVQVETFLKQIRSGG